MLRLSEEKARRLTAMVRRQTARRWGAIALGLMLLFAGASYLFSRQLSRADRTLAVMSHVGTVVGITRASPRSSIAHVQLDDGRDIDALSQARLVLPAGTHVIVSEARHASGRLTYDIKGLSH